jgi:hypothetical protein
MSYRSYRRRMALRRRMSGLLVLLLLVCSFLELYTAAAQLQTPSEAPLVRLNWSKNVYERDYSPEFKQL